MKITLPPLNVTPAILMRNCGYVTIENPHKNNEISYARNLHAGNFYPRFHVYIEKTRQDTVLSLHLDAKKPSYEGANAHSGEYDGELVETEMQRLRAALTSFIADVAIPKKLGF
ncbi:MAG TPA: hypothetical protein VJH70_00590 [Candidatus Paceibacterota bacterium]